MNPLLIGPLAEVIKNVIGRIWPDPAKQAEAQLKLATMVQNGDLARLTAETDLAKAQINVNAVEAAGDGFRANWRPFIGWVCGSALAWNYIMRPWVVFGSALYGHPLDLPAADMMEMMPVLLGMLGLGGFRTIEKVKNAQ